MSGVIPKYSTPMETDKLLWQIFKKWLFSTLLVQECWAINLTNHLLLTSEWIYLQSAQSRLHHFQRLLAEPNQQPFNSTIQCINPPAAKASFHLATGRYQSLLPRQLSVSTAKRHLITCRSPREFTQNMLILTTLSLPKRCHNCWLKPTKL